MPAIHTISIPVFLDSIPVQIPRPYEVLTRRGMAAASVLFDAKQFPPLRLRTVSVAADKAGARLLADRFIALIRQRVAVNDGITVADGTVILSVASTLTDAGLVLLGDGSSGRWLVEAEWVVLLDADRDTR
jgi:hypothetical protein